MLTACQQAVSITCMTYTYRCMYSARLLPDDGQRNCLKHVEFYSKNKFEKLVHLVGFIIRKRSVYCIISHQIFFLIPSTFLWMSLLTPGFYQHTSNIFIYLFILFIYLFIYLFMYVCMYVCMYGCHLFYIAYSVLRCSTLQIYLLLHSSTPFCPRDVVYVCIAHCPYSSPHHALVSNSAAVCAV